uniref:Alpha-2-macroglobulin domain-containing protein n=1 Tax=Clastoptera arizonana TaxID=38151 RepID=A0A1B6EA02_9HEMI
MAPGFTLLVLHITQQGEVLADMCFTPVNAFKRYNTELELNTGKDYKAERVEIRVSGDVGAFIGVNSLRAVSYLMQAGNQLTESRVADSLMSFENFYRSIQKVVWRSRDGSSADQSYYFSSMNHNIDVNKTFENCGLIALSTLSIEANPNSEICKSSGQLSCAVSGCYNSEQKCNGQLDCSDGYDERDCLIEEESDYEYKISRMSRTTFLYDADDGDWGWREIKKNDHEGVEFEPLMAPRMADDWYFTAFSMSSTLGFSVIPAPVQFSTKRPLVMHLSGPSSCRHGEQVGLRLILLNNDRLEALVLLQLVGSDHYKFIQVEMNGIVSSYSARLTSGDHQVLVYLAPESQQHIDFPIVPTINQGTINIMFVATAQTGRSICKHTITVYGEGGQINKHTSLFLDLKNRALVLSYLDIVVEESPIVPYEEWRRYVFGSPKASITLTGDLIGPVFTTTPLTTDSLLGRIAKGTDARVFELAANIWALHYLRLTNQLQLHKLKETLEEANVIMANIMRRYNSTGSFRNWDTSLPSVWLTAWTIRVFKHATFPDWEYYLYIDPKIFNESVSWLLKHQTEKGSFVETYSTVFDSKYNTNNSEVALTALVVVTLSETLGLISGNVRSASAIAIQRATQYLESLISIPLSIDIFQLSLSTYALTFVKSDKFELAYSLLYSKRKQNYEGLIYWSTEEIPSNPIKLENQRPFLRPRLYHENDSLAVETTSWAMLVVLQREGITNTTDKIIQWLTSVRMFNSGFISTFDSAVAFQAFTEYAFRARLQDITDISVAVDMTAEGNRKHKMHIGNSSFQQPEIIKLNKIWGHVNVVAKGAGQAVVQMDVSYGIDIEHLREVSTYPTFGLNVTEYYSTYRNKSIITIQSCLRWVRSLPPYSSAAVLEMEIPTGYHLLESEAENIAKSGVHPTLRDGKTAEGKTVWFFDKVEQEWSCFNHTIRRWYPVANLTKYRQAILYESTARERFVQVLFNSTPLYVLNICEVCGSYQCPYCPFYNLAAHLLPSFTPEILLLLLYFQLVCL